MESINKRLHFRVQPIGLYNWAVGYWSLALVLTFGLLCRLVLAVLPLETSFGLSVPDDAYYYFTIARNLANGFGITSDRLTPTNGFHPLWLLLITPIWRLTTSPDVAAHLALAISALLNCLAGLSLYFISWRLTLSRRVSLLALAIFLFNPYGITSAVNGLETSLAVLLFGLYLLNLWDLWNIEKASPGRWLVTGVLWGTLLLARTDYIFIVLTTALALFFHKRNRLSLASVLTLALGGGLALLPWLVWNVLVFGTISQVSGDAYPYYLHSLWFYHNGTGIQPLLSQELTLLYNLIMNLGRNLGFGRFLPFVVLLGGGVLAFYRNYMPQAARFLLAPTVGATLLLFYHALYRWMIVDWYFVPLAFLAAIWLALAIMALWHNGLRLFSLAALACLLALYIYSGWSLAAKGGVYPDQPATALTGICSPNSRIGVSDSGWAGYWNPCQVVNLDGVVNNEAFYAIRDKRFNEYVKSLRLDAIYLDDIISELVQRQEGQTPKTR